MYESAGEVLARAYYNHPIVTYILPDADTREDVLSWFFGAVIPTNVLDRGIIRRWINVNRHLESIRRRIAEGDVQSCYVETFNETDLPFYTESGFQIAGAGRIPEGGPNFWALIRVNCKKSLGDVRHELTLSVSHAIFRGKPTHSSRQLAG
jgi:hypothetical protein